MGGSADESIRRNGRRNLHLAGKYVARSSPTHHIADYLFGRMKANGETRQAMEKCSCSIGVNSTLLTYDRYEEAEVFLSLGQIAGERDVIFRTSEQVHSAVPDLPRAQVEAELRCF